MNYVTAIRGKVKRQFAQSTWETMPMTKYGWKQCADEPDSVKMVKAQLAAGTTPEDYSKQIADAREAVKAADEKYLKAVQSKRSTAKPLKEKKAAEAHLKSLLHAEISK